MKLSSFLEKRIHNDNVKVTSDSVSISYTDEPLYLDAIPHRFYASIRYLQLAHCGIRTLEGIQPFCHLIEVNLKFNQLRDVTEIHRISAKNKLVSLNLTGNQIQYFKEMRYHNLHHIFPSLKNLNGKEYRLTKSKKEKPIKMNQIMERLKTVEKEMLKTLRKAPKKQPINRMNTLPQHMDIFHAKTVQDYEYEQADEGSQEEMPQFENQVAIIEESEQELKDISLGNLSNIPLVKSIRKSDNLHKRKSSLLINTSQINGDHIAEPVTQPTATFASQRDKENYASCNSAQFVFKADKEAKTKRQIYDRSVAIEPEEDYESKPYLKTSKNNEIRQPRKNAFSFENQSADGSFSILQKNTRHIQEAINQAASQFYRKQIFEKVMKGFRASSNLPFQHNF